MEEGSTQSGRKRAGKDFAGKGDEANETRIAFVPQHKEPEHIAENADRACYGKGKGGVGACDPEIDGQGKEGDNGACHSRAYRVLIGVEGADKNHIHDPKGDNAEHTIHERDGGHGFLDAKTTAVKKKGDDRA